MSFGIRFGKKLFGIEGLLSFLLHDTTSPDELKLKKANRLVFGVGIGSQLGVDRDQPVLPTNLHAMAGKAYNRHV
jgi:hypothetical protein